MKVIELLNKIANGNIPKRIIYDKYVYQWNNKIRNYEREVDIAITLNWDYIAIECLNEQVEILEEPIISKLYINNELQYNLEEKKIPEKLNILQFSDLIDMSKEELIETIKEQRFKINKIIDYLKSKGDE